MFAAILSMDLDLESGSHPIAVNASCEHNGHVNVGCPRMILLGNKGNSRNAGHGKGNRRMALSQIDLVKV